MLTLGDQEAGRPDYLPLLGGLIKLRAVYGYVFHVNNPEQDKTVRWAEDARARTARDEARVQMAAESETEFDYVAREPY
ncbi:hypothetical protein BGX29_006536 [Mortierella sp. GBA35]|nr:hypothetical protein BGX29_006536 [Mortierella sp. GBA35]